ncbi:MAG: hypothetical protein AAGF11_15230 [Myxococcota bacterium]
MLNIVAFSSLGCIPTLDLIDAETTSTNTGETASPGSTTDDRASTSADGESTGSCPSGACTCDDGACKDCQEFAETNDFNTARAIEGWEFSGGWRLYRAAPQNYLEGPVEFAGQVLGTDGDRAAPYYPGAQNEDSYARTPPSPLPVELTFQSWHVDEGGSRDSKSVRVSVDNGATWEVLVDCDREQDQGLAMCTQIRERAADDWEMVTLPIPSALRERIGIVEFGYDSNADCCDYERGWFIDALNVATECACQTDSDCAAYRDACSVGTCAPSGQCTPMPWPAQAGAVVTCGDLLDSDCDRADTCDDLGYCRENIQPNGLALCTDCPGDAPCGYCVANECSPCADPVVEDGFGYNDSEDGPAWVVEDLSTAGTGADWGVYSAPPITALHGGQSPPPFPNAPIYGTDGNRQFPYPGVEEEHARVTTSASMLTQFVTFSSWNVDGGSPSFFGDNKIIELSVDGGNTWETLVNCAMGSPQPFCTWVTNRALDDWDTITLDTSKWAGQLGQLRLTYETMGANYPADQGWYIDDLRLVQCDDTFVP